MSDPVITLGSVTLPGDLQWTDEFSWSPVARSQDYGLTGSLILQESAKQAGRPITLQAGNPGNGLIWLARAVVEALYTLSGTPGWVGTLTLSDSRTFTVVFRDEGLVAETVRHIAPPETGDPYTLTIKLQTV